MSFGTFQVFRAAGPTIGLSVAATSHAAVPLTVTSNDTTTYCALLNTGTVAVAVTLSVAGTASTLPGDGTTGSFVLPAAMFMPLVVPLPSATQTNPCQITAIGAAAGPSLIYATPVVLN